MTESFTLGAPLDVASYDVDVEEEMLSAESVGQVATYRVSDQLLADADLDQGELTEVLAHSRATVAAAQYRMLQVASLIHDAHAEDYLAEMSVTHGEVTPEEMADIIERGRRPADPSHEFGPDGLERAMADVGATLSVPAAQARTLIEAGHALRYRLPFTAIALSCGRIDLHRFQIAVKRTELCAPDTIERIDCRISEAILGRDQMSIARFTALVDSIVAKVDPVAMKRRRERAQADRRVTIRPDRFAPGQSRVSAQVAITDGAVLDAALDSMAAGVHAGDPRTLEERRADALPALARRLNHLPCRCENCLAVANTPDEGPEPTLADPAPADPEPAASAPSGPVTVIHVIANQSTIDGEDDDPGYVDGHGTIDADTVRDLVADPATRVVGVDPARLEQWLTTNAYRPGKRAQAFVRTGELCCTFPGCNNAVWTCDLDHTTPFDHTHPERGGATAPRNLKPLCRFHHRIKTFTHWRDFQDSLGAVVFESPTGHLFYGNAFRGTDLFPKRRAPDHPARAQIEKRLTCKRARTDGADARWSAAHPPPF